MPGIRASSMRIVCKSALLCLLLLVATAVAEDHPSTAEKKEQEDFQAKLKDAEEAQEFKEDVTTPVEAHIVKEAPEATLANGDGDVATTGVQQCGRECCHAGAIHVWWF